MSWEAVIGLEVHCQLETQSKLFSPCPVEIGAAPNTRTDPYTWGLPGTLPVPNEAAVRFAIALALATGCRIAPLSRFARKHYFYPDLPKGYQITQSDEPYAVGGVIEVPGATAPGNGGPVRVRLTRIHLEEDAGKNIHAGGRVEAQHEAGRERDQLPEGHRPVPQQDLDDDRHVAKQRPCRRQGVGGPTGRRIQRGGHRSP